MRVPAGIRKTGPWVVCRSGIVATQNVSSRYYLDRQSSLEVFHRKCGLILSGANSKRQPEPATFRERVGGQTHHMPPDARLRMGEQGDRLSPAFNTFVANLEVDPASDTRMPCRFTVKRKGRPEEAFITLQLCLKPGEALETGAGRKLIPGEEPDALAESDLGGSIRHRGWTLAWEGAARLEWPVYPYTPYGEDSEKSLEYAAGASTFPIEGIGFTLEAR
jgi:hypothetical protein